MSAGAPADDDALCLECGASDVARHTGETYPEAVDRCAVCGTVRARFDDPLAWPVAADFKSKEHADTTPLNPVGLADACWVKITCEECGTEGYGVDTLLDDHRARERGIVCLDCDEERKAEAEGT